MPERLRGMCGAEVVSAPLACTGLQAVLDVRSDVVVSDLGMPREDGDWLIREVQTRMGALPAVAVTGFSDRYHPIQARAAGFREDLNKPVDPDILCGTVAKVCDRAG